MSRRNPYGLSENPLDLGEMLCAFLRLAKGLSPEGWGLVDHLFNATLLRFCELVDRGPDETMEHMWEVFLDSLKKDCNFDEFANQSTRFFKEKLVCDFAAKTTWAINDIRSRLEGQSSFLVVGNMVDAHAQVLHLAEQFEQTWRSGYYQKRNAMDLNRVNIEREEEKETDWIQKAPKTYRNEFSTAADAPIGETFQFPQRINTNKKRLDYIKTLNRNIPKEIPWVFGKKGNLMVKHPRGSKT